MPFRSRPQSCLTDAVNGYAEDKKMHRKLAIHAIGLTLLTAASGAQAWTDKDTAWEVAYLTAHIADWGQTLDISAQCSTGAYSETNKILGSCPSGQKVNAYFLGTALLHYGVAQMLPGNYRRMFQAGTLAMEIGFVSNNTKIGLNVKF